MKTEHIKRKKQDLFQSLSYRNRIHSGSKKFITVLCVIIFFAGIINSLHGQKVSKADSLRKAFGQSRDYKEYITTGGRLCNELLRSDPQEAVLTGNLVLHMIDSLLKEDVISDSVADRMRLRIGHSIGNAYGHLGDVNEQRKLMMTSLELAKHINDRRMECTALEQIANSYEQQGYMKEAILYFRKALALAEEVGDTYLIALELGNIGAVMVDAPDSALWYYRQSLSQMQKPGMQDREGAMGWMMQNIGEIFEKKEQVDSALHYYQHSLAIRRSIDHLLGQSVAHEAIARLMFKQGNAKEALENINTGIQIALENNFIQSLYSSYKLRSEINARLGKHKEALADLLNYMHQRDSIVNEANTKQLVQQSMRYEYGRKMLADSLEFSKKEAVLTERTQKQRIGLIATMGGLALLILLARSIYKGKKRSDELLLNILPEETARELKQKGRSEAKLIDEVSVLFTDFKEFTQFSEKLSPKELVAEIDLCFREFDNIVQKYGVEKIKTIGDSYMCAGGLPVPNKTHATDVVNAAIEIQQFMQKLRVEREAQGKLFFEIRIGIHSGPVVAGIVGVKKYSYDIWGDTVNTASRIESSGEAGKVNISGATYELVKDRFNCKYRGKIQAKNKGEIDMYFVETLS